MARMSINDSIGMDHRTQKVAGSVDGPMEDNTTVRVDSTCTDGATRTEKLGQDRIGPTRTTLLLLPVEFVRCLVPTSYDRICIRKNQRVDLLAYLVDHPAFPPYRMKYPSNVMWTRFSGIENPIVFERSRLCDHVGGKKK